MRKLPDYFKKAIQFLHKIILNSFIKWSSLGFSHESNCYKLNGKILKDILTRHIYGIINDVTFQPANFFSTTSHRHVLCQIWHRTEHHQDRNPKTSRRPRGKRKNIIADSEGGNVQIKSIEALKVC